MAKPKLCSEPYHVTYLHTSVRISKSATLSFHSPHSIIEDQCMEGSDDTVSRKMSKTRNQALPLLHANMSTRAPAKTATAQEDSYCVGLFIGTDCRELLCEH